VPFRGWGKSAGTIPSKPSWSVRSASKRWRSIFKRLLATHRGAADLAGVDWKAAIYGEAVMSVAEMCALAELSRAFAFFRAWRNLSVRYHQNQVDLGRAPPPIGRPPSPVKGRDGRNYAPCSWASSAMSSGWLFLDRGARQQCPSPLNRRAHPKPFRDRAQSI
jgi:hypothetical protein